MRRLISKLSSAALLAGAFVLAGCSAAKKRSTWEARLANMMKDIAIPIQAERVKDPLPASPEVIQRGSNDYQMDCALCHGPDGRAETTLGRAMYPPAMDLNSPHVQHWSDGDLFWIIQNGIRLTGMPAWKGILTDDDIWQIVRFIQSLPQQNAQAQAASEKAASAAELIAIGHKLYRQEGCFMCHRLDGDGGNVGPDLSCEATRHRSHDWLIGHFRDPAKYSPGTVMVPFKNLTQGQLDALVALLDSETNPCPKNQ
jgi:mono/diheme cytochrome c family protein